ncbi:hypothetical protein E4T50_06145 [Aureobasidium sp. EXF-12298]|nr:hypothetical protein E4T50_06145 [Aureobasidium sp. EXF-12298]KAI4777927.1 hypothetical protein E4T52_07132 [Aureobasidium sp. EXF-3400]
MLCGDGKWRRGCLERVVRYATLFFGIGCICNPTFSPHQHPATLDSPQSICRSTQAVCGVYGLDYAQSDASRCFGCCFRCRQVV